MLRRIFSKFRSILGGAREMVAAVIENCGETHNDYEDRRYRRDWNQYCAVHGLNPMTGEKRQINDQARRSGS